jgi:formylglycine-generating enzyme required for sulfatase activity
MSDSVPPSAALQILQALLADNTIDQSRFDLLAAPHLTAKPTGAVEQTADTGGINAAGDNLGNMNSGVQVFVTAAVDASADNSEALRHAYLSRLLKTTGAGSLLGSADAQKQVRLAAVYTALLTNSLPLPPVGQGKRRDLPPSLLYQDLRWLSAVEVLNREHRLVLLGGPGSGKSTFVNFVAQCMAGELLGVQAPKHAPTLAHMTAPLPPDEDGADRADNKRPPQPQPWQHGALLPVIVVLRDLAAQMAPGELPNADCVWRYIERSFADASLSNYAPAMKAALLGGHALVMFDGLDEVPEAHLRREHIKKAVGDFEASFSQCRMLVTSRTYAYQEQEWKLPGFAQAELRVFSFGQISNFVRAWYEHLSTELMQLTPADAQGRGTLLLRQVQRLRDVRELAERPLLLTMMVRLQKTLQGDLPSGREELYAKSVDMLLNEWEASKQRRQANGQVDILEPSLGEYLGASPQEIRKQLNRLAFDAHREQADLQGTANIRENDLVAALVRANPQKAVNVEQLKTYLRDRAGILASHAGAMWQFPHRSFQEYLAACHLVNDDYPNQLAGLLRAEPLRWREVTLLAAAHAALGNTSLPTWALTEALCPLPVAAGGAATDADLWGALLAGEVLAATDEHRQPKPQDQAKLERVRQWQVALLASSLPTIERALAGRSLATLIDPRPEVMTVDAMQFCAVPAGPFVMEGNEYDDEKPVHTVQMAAPYFMARFPVSLAQWQELMGSEGEAAGHLNGPVTRVSWRDAVQFCERLTKRWQAWLPAGMVVALPSEAEWEKAARGGAELPLSPWFCTSPNLTHALTAVASLRCKQNAEPRRNYPWGSSLQADKPQTWPMNADAHIGQTSAMGCFQSGASPYGCEDMAGNVWEWTRRERVKYSYQPESKSESMDGTATEGRVVRGGSWFDSAYDARCDSRTRAGPNDRGDDLGFRVVLCSAPV